MHQDRITVPTSGRGLHDVTAEVRRIVATSGVRTGLVVVFCRHTSCSLLIQENYDPSAGSDLMEWLARIAPEGDPAYRHTSEGRDDMPSHLRAAVTSTSETIPVADGDLVLGTWQGILLLEHRRRAHRREVFVHVQGE